MTTLPSRWALGAALTPLAACAPASPAPRAAPPTVEVVRIPREATEQAPPVCPAGATWEQEGDRCVVYVPVQHPPATPLDLAHMPDPCSVGGPNAPGLFDCDPDSQYPRDAGSE